jgi:transposase
MESEAKKTEELLKRVSELEQVVGQKQLEIDYLNKLLELSSLEFKVDIEKKFRHQALHSFHQEHKTKNLSNESGL